MNIALYGKSFSDDFGSSIQQLVTILEEANCCIYIYEPFNHFINKKVHFNKKVVTFTEHNEIRNKLNYLISIGGDGTLLSTITLIRDSNIPVVGINTGRLGFLASISKNDILNAVNAILENRIIIEKRSLLKRLILYDNNKRLCK